MVKVHGVWSSWQYAGCMAFEIEGRVWRHGHLSESLKGLLGVHIHFSSFEILTFLRIHTPMFEAVTRSIWPFQGRAV